MKHVVVHSDDWSSGNGSQIREDIIQTLSGWDGKLIETPHDPLFSAGDIRNKIRSMGTTPQLRMERFHRILKSKPVMRVIEAHNGLTGLIAEEAEATTDDADLSVFHPAQAQAIDHVLRRGGVVGRGEGPRPVVEVKKAVLAHVAGCRFTPARATR